MKDKLIDKEEQLLISEKLAKAFEINIQKGYSFCDLVSGFAKSSFSKTYFHDYTVFGQSPGCVACIIREYLDEQGIKPTKYEPADEDPAFWVGYLSGRLFYDFRKFLSEIIEKRSIQYLYDNYDILHTQSIRYAINFLLSDDD